MCNTHQLPEMVTDVCATFQSSRKTSEIRKFFLGDNSVHKRVAKQLGIGPHHVQKLPMIASGILNFSLYQIMRIV